MLNQTFYHLRQLAKINTVLSQQHFGTEIHAWITVNTLYFDISDSRSLSFRGWMPHVLHESLIMFPVLASLQWLPIHYRTHFKVLLLFMALLHPICLSGYTLKNPLGLSGLLSSYSWLCQRKSISWGVCAFSEEAPKLWTTFVWTSQVLTPSVLNIHPSYIIIYSFSLALEHHLYCLLLICFDWTLIDCMSELFTALWSCGC